MADVENHPPSEDGEALSSIEVTQKEEAPTAVEQRPMPTPSPQPQWLAIYTGTHHEKHVRDVLQDHSIETFLPLYAVARRWKKSRPASQQLPLFPNYIFVRLTRTERVRVLSVPGVLSIVGSGRESWSIPEQEIEMLRSALKVRNFEPHPYLAVGERVRVKAGPLAGMEGILSRKKNGLRVVLSMDLIMMSTAVEVYAEDLEPIWSRDDGKSCATEKGPARPSGRVA